MGLEMYTLLEDKALAYATYYTQHKLFYILYSRFQNTSFV